MAKKCRSSLLYALSILAIMMFTAVAGAQECDTYCNPATSGCDETCDVCTHQGIDGCDGWRSSTCGEETYGCIPSNCTPSWYESSRVTQGTYGNGNWNSCSHHSMQWVGVTDSHSCNVNSSLYTYHYCEDHLDGGKSGWFPDCCDGNPWTCNSYHSCTG